MKPLSCGFRAAPPFSTGRRKCLQLVAMLGAVMVSSRPARAASPQLSKSAVSYQPLPSGSKRCDNCVHFIAEPHTKQEGHCQIVTGTVSKEGYCMVWAALNPVQGC